MNDKIYFTEEESLFKVNNEFGYKHSDHLKLDAQMLLDHFWAHSTYSPLQGFMIGNLDRHQVENIVEHLGFQLADSGHVKINKYGDEIERKLIV